MSRTVKSILVAALLTALLVACGGESPTNTPPPPPTPTPLPPTATPIPPSDTPELPTDTPPPPTNTPIPPTPTPTTVQALELEEEEFSNEVAGYAIRLPQGWEHWYYEDTGADLFHAPGEPIQEILEDQILPEMPIVAISAGSVATVLEGQLEGAEDAQEVLDTLVGWVSGNEEFEEGEVETLTVAGEEALAVDLSWSEREGPVNGRDVVLFLGDRVIIIQGIGKPESWEEFGPTFGAMLESMTIFEPGPSAPLALTKEYDGGTYTILYPEGWEAYARGSMTAFVESRDIFDEEIPSVPLILIETGHPDTLYDGATAGAQTAEEMLKAVGEARAAEGDEFEMGDIGQVRVGDELAAAVRFLWVEENVPAMNLMMAIHKGDWALLAQAVGTIEGWEGFASVYGEMMDSLTLKEPEWAGQVDFADPASVAQAVFTAAQTQDFSVLWGLCDPLGEHDGDAQVICEITNDHPDKDAFVEYFAGAEIIGEPVIEGDQAQVPFVYGPDGDQEETMILIRRDGKWYLLGF